MSDSFVSQILPNLYGCADQPEHWSGVLDQICQEVEVRSTAVQIMRKMNGRFCPLLNVRDSFSVAQAPLHDKLVNNDQNPRFDLNVPPAYGKQNVIVRDEDRFRANCPRFAEFRGRLAMAGLGRSIAIVTPLSAEHSVCLIMHRSHGDGREFDTDDERFLRDLMPHLKRSVEIFEKMYRLREFGELITEAANQVSTGIAICDLSGDLRWYNKYAGQIFERSRHLSVAGTRLNCSTPTDHDKILRLLSRAGRGMAPDARVVATIGQHDDDPLHIMALPLRRTASPADSAMPRFEAVVLLFAERTVKFDLPASDIKELFGLTPAEAKLAAALCDGMSLNDYAVNHGISVGTARIQLKSIFSKTGTGRQPELVRLLCTSIPARALPFGVPTRAFVYRRISKGGA